MECLLSLLLLAYFIHELIEYYKHYRRENDRRNEKHSIRWRE